MMKRPIITSSGESAEIISLELIKEYIGYEGDLDAEQDSVLKAVRQAAIEQGEQITGCRWAATSYVVEEVQGYGSDMILPLSPALAVDKVVCGSEVIPQEQYRFIPSAVDMGRPWGFLRSSQGWQGEYDITCTVGWTSESLPDSLRSWALIRISTLFDNREDLAPNSTYGAMPRHHADGLLDRWRVIGSPYG